MHICSNSLQCDLCIQTDDTFCNFIQQALLNVEGALFSPRIRESVLAAMVDEEWSSTKPMALNQDVIRPRLWKIFWSVVGRSDPLQMETGLQDSFCLFLENSSNASVLSKLAGWQAWLLQFFALPDNAYQGCKILAHNILVRVLYWCYMKTARFPWILQETLLAIEVFPSVFTTSDDSLDRSYSLFSGTLALLTNYSQLFPVTPDMSQVCYSNLPHLFRTLELFLCYCIDWGNRVALSEDSLSQKSRRLIINNLVQNSLVSRGPCQVIVRRQGSTNILSDVITDVDRVVELIAEGSDVGFHHDSASGKFRFHWALNIARKGLTLLKTLHITPEVLFVSSGTVSAEEKRVVNEMSKYCTFLKSLDEFGTALHNQQTSGEILSRADIVQMTRSFLYSKSAEKRSEFVKQLHNRRSSNSDSL
eukprot:TRINITY_DN27872_c0_g1_i1.p1 TRINITY_DN27872_c0_g1~~TRINITY_DN27872_c0_g1_i1.p1  ORF type:complete len:419 (-),score=57.57 TRINITY_DN27872_c0_g1_i1:58-1314(-)